MAAATMAIRVMPPIITSASKTESTLAVIRGSSENVLSKPAAMLLICGKFPVPKELSTVAMAKMIANHLAFIPFSI